MLAIADGHGAGINLPKYGVLSAQALSAQIAATGLRLPVTFLLMQDRATGFFLGRILPRRYTIHGSNQKEYDIEQLLILYQHVVDAAVSQLAKSTPLAERRACAREALCAAAAAYVPGCGDMEAYLEIYLRDSLLSNNRQFTSTYFQRSLDQPLVQNEGGSFCLYDTAAVSNSGGLDGLEIRIMMEQFFETLFAQEQELLRMLFAGSSLSEIAQVLRLSEQEIVSMSRTLGQKRKRFFEEP